MSKLTGKWVRVLAKLRQVIIDGQRYLWQFSPGYCRTAGLVSSIECCDRFTAWLEGNKTSPLRIEFTTWEDPVIGGPLRTGVPLILGDSCSPSINLHESKWAAEIIRAALREGWNPSLTKYPLRIENGIEFLQQNYAHHLIAPQTAQRQEYD
jgi:hypothetical protein